jgi:hypothetical protein
MQQAIGKFCGPFAQPKQPFVSQPFFGHYATGGRPRSPAVQFQPGTSGTTTAPTTGTTGAATPAPTATSTPKAKQGFDPNTYETPPQGQADTGGAAAPAATSTPG